MGKLRRPSAAEMCVVSRCGRFASKTSPGFCNRCWGQASEGEQTMMRFAQHAPFWRTSGWDDEEDTFAIHAGPGDDALAVRYSDRSWKDTRYGTTAVVCTVDGKKVYEVTWGKFLADFEARTTEAVLAQRLADRRLGRRFNDGEML